ncbi:MAG: DUF3109 family protein [Prevotella sp.]|nr:DUF3109 family protein [Prevotella sp.]
MKEIPPILQVGDVLLTSEILTEHFCCDLTACKGACCIEGDAGAPVTLDEVGEIEDCLDEVWDDLSATAQSIIDRQGVAYTDTEGDLVTSIVGGKDCVFTYYDDIKDFDTQEPIDGCCLCALEKAFRRGKTRFCKPVSCALYPIREKALGNGLTGLNYNRWNVCKAAIEKGKAEDLPLYRFLEGPLRRRFGDAWYEELCEVAQLFL